jgi:hypothetical protein
LAAPRRCVGETSGSDPTSFLSSHLGDALAERMGDVPYNGCSMRRHPNNPSITELKRSKTFGNLWEIQDIVKITTVRLAGPITQRIGWITGWTMTYSLKQQIEDCYRRAEEYRRLYNQSANLNARESYFLTAMHLTRLADHLRRQLRGKDRDEFESQIP